MNPPVSPVLLRVWLLPILLVLQVLALPVNAGEALYTKGLLWEIHKPGLRSSYLFGTIHSEDPRVTRLPAEVEQAFIAADRLVIEVVLDAESLLTLATAALLTDGSNLKQLVGDTLFARTVKAMESYGLPEQVLLMMKPWAVATTLMMPRSETGLFLDRLLYERAVAAPMPVAGLETAQEQMDAFDRMPLSQQVALLRDAVDNVASLDAFLAQLHETYLARDLAGLAALSDEAMAESPAELVETINRNIVIERNHLMALRMEEHLARGNSFVAVGALHLPGEEGILSLLVQRGYRVTPRY